MCPSLNLPEPHESELRLELVRPTLSLLMSIMYVAKHTRCDLLFPTRYLSQFANEKRCTLQKVFDAAVQVAQYGEHTATLIVAWCLAQGYFTYIWVYSSTPVLVRWCVSVGRTYFILCTPIVAVQ